MLSKSLQRKFLLGGVLWLPALPFLFLQSRWVRWKVGRLPDASGETKGKTHANGETLNFLAIGESTIAGIGAATHETALTGQFAKHLSLKTGKTICWQALGISGITAERAIRELIPQLPGEKQDIVLIALGGNDVFHLHSPNRSRHEMLRLIGIIKENYPSSLILLANVPMVRDFTALPDPLRYFLSRVAKLHHFNTKDMAAGLESVFYYEPQGKFKDEHFSDGVHPSELGYDLWAEEMVKFFGQKGAFLKQKEKKA